MKRIILLAGFLCISSLGWAKDSLIQNDVVRERGREQFRDSLLSQERQTEGLSGSNQYVDFFRPRREGGEYKLSGHGLLLGTNSNLLSHPELYLGTSLGYFRGRERKRETEENEKERFYEVNAEMAYLKNKILVLAGLGYSEMRNTPAQAKRYREKEGHLFLEFGKLYSFTENQYLYSYLGGEISKYEREIEKPKADLGLRYTWYFREKFSLQMNASYTKQWKMEEKKEREHSDLSAKLAYRWYEDLEVYLQHRHRWQKKERQVMTALGFSHYF